MEQNPKPVPETRGFLGFHQARVDEKGRLKLPAKVQEYLSELGEKQVFITTIDLLTVRLYPIPVWKENEKLFEGAGQLTEEAERIAFIAKHYGAEAELDMQGRVLVPQGLRRDLGLENQPVYLGYDKGAIEVLSDVTYQHKLAEAKAALTGSLSAMKKAGLK